MGKSAHGAGSLRASGMLTAWSPHAVCASGVTVARLSTARWRLAGGKVLPVSLRGATGRTSGKEEEAGAHEKGGSTVRQRKRQRAAVFISGGVAPVVVDECGEILQLEGDKGGMEGAVD
jgi:hypothetical protein